MAWVSGLVILSSLPDIAFRSATGARSSPIWIPSLALLLLVLALVVARQWSSVEGLHGYLLALVALASGYLAESVVEHSTVWVSWNRSLAPGVSFVLVNSAKLIPVTTLAVSLIGSGFSRADLFLAMGDLRALFIRIGGRFSLSWGWLLPIALLLSVGPVVANVVAARHPDFGTAARLLPLAPLIVTGAAINTFSEEFLFRQVLLARLLPVLGVTQAIWLTALRFGVGHWFGNPSGLTGVLLATVFGWLLRDRCSTREGQPGFGWFI